MAPTTDPGAATSSSTTASATAMGGNAHAKRKPLPGLAPEWENFGLCMMFHLLLPLLPLGVEYFASGKVTGPSVTMASGMYVIGVTSGREELLKAMEGKSVAKAAYVGRFRGEAAQ